MDNSMETFNQLSKIIRQCENETNPEINNKLKENFREILHSNNDAFIQDSMYSDYVFDLLQKMLEPTNNSIDDLTSILLEPNLADYVLSLTLNDAVALGNINLYEKIENKVKHNLKDYPELYEQIQTGSKLEQYLKTAIGRKQIPFIKMILKNNAQILLKMRFNGQSIYNFIYQSNLDPEQKKDTLNHMIKLGYPGLDFNLNQDSLFQLTMQILSSKDKEALVQLLSSNVAIDFLLNKDLDTPNELIKKNNNINATAESLLKNEFNFMDNSKRSFNQLSKIIRQCENETNPEINNKLKENFREILHSNNDAFIQDSMYSDYVFDLLQKMLEPTNNSIDDLTSILLEPNLADYVLSETLYDAIALGNINLYEKIENKIKNNPKDYPKLYEQIENGSKLEQYLKTAIGRKQIPFIKMILKNNAQILLKMRFNDQSIYNFIYQSNLDPEQKKDTLNHMIKLGYPGLDFNLNRDNLFQLTMQILSSKDKEALVQLLSSGVAINFLVNNILDTPNELIQKNNDINSTAESLLKNEFNIFNFDVLITHLKSGALSPEKIELFFMMNNLSEEDRQNKTFLLASEAASALNNPDQSSETKKKIFEAFFDPIFNSMPTNANAQDQDKNFDLVHSNYLTYLINNWQAHIKYISALNENAFYNIEDCILIGNALKKMQLNEFFNAKQVEQVFNGMKFISLKSCLSNSILHSLKNQTVLSSDKLSLAFSALYPKYLNKIHQMVFIEQAKEQSKETYHGENIKNNVIYNNNQYFDDKNKPSGEDFTEGNPLYLDELKTIPIGYNIHLPQGEVEGIIVEMYGGFRKGEAERKGYRPGVINSSQEYLLNRGIAVVTLNLPDFLKLEVYQGVIPETLYLEIQQCIHHFGDTLKNNPELLHEKLKNLKLDQVKMMLYGASFGGGMAIGQAELFNGQYGKAAFNGFISHDGSISGAISEKSDLLITNRAGRPTIEHLHFEQADRLKKITKPILLLQNSDDNNVSIKIMLDFYKKMRKAGKSNLTRMLITKVGNPTPSDASDISNKGHYLPTNKNDAIVYNETILNFIKKGLSALPEFTELEGYRQDKLANKFFRSGTLEQKFVAEAVELFEKQLSEQEKLDHNLVKSANISNQINKEWDEKHKPLYYAMHQAKNLAQDAAPKWEEPRRRLLLEKEIARLKNDGLLTDEVIVKTLLFQSGTFFPFIEEIHHVKLSNDINLTEVFSHPAMIEECRKTLDSLPQQFDDSFVNFFLSSLYKANPALLKPLYPTFETDSVIQSSLNAAKAKLIKTVSKGQNLLLTAYTAQAKLQQKDSSPTLPTNTLQIEANPPTDTIKKPGQKQ